MLAGFGKLGALSARGCPARSTCAATASSVGEGAAVVILAAARAGAAVELAGEARSLDAHHLTAPNPNGAGPSRAMRAALGGGRGRAPAIDYVQAHGTSTPLNDAVEAAALRRALGAALDAGPRRVGQGGDRARGRAGRGRWDFYVPMRPSPTACCCRPPAWKSPTRRARCRTCAGGRSCCLARHARRWSTHSHSAARTPRWCCGAAREQVGGVARLDSPGVRPERGRAQRLRRRLARPGGVRAPRRAPRARSRCRRCAANDEPCEPRQRKLMSRAAYLGAAAIKLALRARGGPPAIPSTAPASPCTWASAPPAATWRSSRRCSGTAWTAASSISRDSASAGLTAANPLFAFQLMNNFTLCHGAILGGLHGPNSAFFSRGAGTVTALREAAFAVAGDEAPIALAGGSDSALHPVTRAELGRGGWIASDLAPAEGAALLALGATAAPDRPHVRLTRAEVHVARGGSLDDAAAAALAIAPGGGCAPAGRAGDLSVGRAGTHGAGRGRGARADRPGDPRRQRRAGRGARGRARSRVGAWRSTGYPRRGTERESVVVLSAGIDGELGIVELTGGGAA